MSRYLQRTPPEPTRWRVSWWAWITSFSVVAVLYSAMHVHAQNYITGNEFMYHTKLELVTTSTLGTTSTLAVTPEDVHPKPAIVVQWMADDVYSTPTLCWNDKPVTIWLDDDYTSTITLCWRNGCSAHMTARELWDKVAP